MPAAPKIIATRQTSVEAENFLKTFIEWSKASDNNKSDAVPKKKPTIAELKKTLREHGPSWKDWKYAVIIKVPVVKGKEKKEVKIFSDINLIQAFIFKKNLKKVKCITELALEKGQDFLDDLLKDKTECLDLDGRTLPSNFSWICNATTIHLATFWHVESLAHFLEISPHLKDIKTEFCKATPLHVAASCDDETVAASLLIRKGADANARMTNHQTPLHIAAQGGFINTVITLLFEGNADAMALNMAKSKLKYLICYFAL